MNFFNLRSCSTGLFGCLILLLLLSVSLADPIRPVNSTEASLPSDPSRTAENESGIVEDPFYNFLKINPSQPPTETSEPQQHSVIEPNPLEASPPSYPAEHVQTTQQETVEVDDPLYNFLKNILPQVPTQASETELPSVPASPSSDPVVIASNSAKKDVETNQRKFAAGESFLNIGPPPKPRALGFPQITNTRENVVQQNNWDIV